MIPTIIYKSVLQGDVTEAYDALEPLCRDERIAAALPHIHSLLVAALDALFAARCEIDDLR